MKKPATPRKKANPSRVIESPLREWLFSDSGERFTTVTLPLDSGEYLSVVLSDPSVRATASSKREAESAVIRLYEHQSREPDSIDDDERDHAMIQDAIKKDRFTPWAEVKRKKQALRRQNVGS